MVQSRLILGAILCAGALSTSSGPSDPIADEREARSHLAALSAAEADFRACDRDWNKVVPAGEPEVVYTLDARSTDCRAGETCASNILTRPVEGWTPEGRYTLTSTSVVLQGTENAVRVIEFTRDSGDELPE